MIASYNETTVSFPATLFLFPPHIFHWAQKKINEAEAKRRGYEEDRDTLKTKIHTLNSLEFKVGAPVRMPVVTITYKRRER